MWFLLFLNKFPCIPLATEELYEREKDVSIYFLLPSQSQHVSIMSSLYSWYSSPQWFQQGNAWMLLLFAGWDAHAETRLVFHTCIMPAVWNALMHSQTLGLVLIACHGSTSYWFREAQWLQPTGCCRPALCLANTQVGRIRSRHSLNAQPHIQTTVGLDSQCKEPVCIYSTLAWSISLF